MDTDRKDRLAKDFEPYFNEILAAREAWTAESRFIPQRTNGNYPTWQEIATQLPRTGLLIRERIAA